MFSKKKDEIRQNIAVNIGASPESIEAYRTAILDIINTSAGDQVKGWALGALQAGVQVNGTVIRDSYFEMKP